mmetsp:Transcript_36778/g.67893  ORF Transcript_36778/g.67893 Transcript_36778/m.67893 type:complete len:90 (+) Transcript_36778:110-379(+)
MRAPPSPHYKKPNSVVKKRKSTMAFPKRICRPMGKETDKTELREATLCPPSTSENNRLSRRPCGLYVGTTNKEMRYTPQGTISIIWCTG